MYTLELCVWLPMLCSLCSIGYFADKGISGPPWICHCLRTRNYFFQGFHLDRNVSRWRCRGGENSKNTSTPKCFLLPDQYLDCFGSPTWTYRRKPWSPMWEPECPLEWPRLFPDLCPQEDQWDGPRIPGEEDWGFRASFMPFWCRIECLALNMRLVQPS